MTSFACFAVLLLPLARPVAARATPGGPAPLGERIERHLGCMGTDLVVEVEASTRSAALAASEAAVRELEATEERLSTWTGTSELARLNATPAGEAFLMSPELAGDLRGALDWWRASGGAFDPGLGALVEAWGLREGGRRPDPGELARALAAGGAASLQIEGRTARRLSEGVRVEEGGFGKGAGLARALEALHEAGAEAALLDLGGQVALLPGGAPVAIGIASPTDREHVVLEIELERGSLATSGNSERGIVVDGEPRSHLLDPRTGRPAPDFGSLTVWAADPLAADCLSTGLYVLGPDRALRWAREHDGVEVLVLEPTPEGLRARATPGLFQLLVVRDPLLRLLPEPARGAASAEKGIR